MPHRRPRGRGRKPGKGPADTIKFGDPDKVGLMQEIDPALTDQYDETLYHDRDDNDLAGEDLGNDDDESGSTSSGPTRPQHSTD